MGRALYSQKYAPAVQAEPQVANYNTWSRWNNFDPDSNEFFIGAQQEVFTDTPEYQRELEEIRRREAATSTPPANPQVVQPITPVEWQDRFHAAGASTGQWERVGDTRSIVERGGTERVIPVYIADAGYRSPSQAAFAPQDVYDSPSRPRQVPHTIIMDGAPSLITSNTVFEEPPSPSPPSPIFRRTVEVDIPGSPVDSDSDSPGTPDSPASPSTPIEAPFDHMMFSPSPPPSVSPHILNWRERQAPPVSPSPQTGHLQQLARRSNTGAQLRLRLATGPVATRTLVGEV